jgi:hypothetical protein
MLDGNPMMQEYLARNPNSVFARGVQPAAQQTPIMPQGQIPSFAAGGMMSEQGQAIRPGQPMPGNQMDTPLGADAPPPLDSGQIEQEANNFIRSNPQVAQQIQQVMAQAMQSGDLTTDELNLMVQLAKAALANPASYPQIRQFAVKNGLGDEASIPQEMDKGLLFTLIVVGKTMQGGTGMQNEGNAMQGQPPAATEKAGLIPEYKDGGETGDKPHLAKLHANEFVIPKDALMYHGIKTFEKLIQQAREPKDGQPGT